MSRTRKDLRVQKALSRKNSCEPLKTSFLRLKSGRTPFRIHEEDFCPDCGGLTNFQSGFLTCAECNWSTFETEEINFNNLTFRPAV
jgi:hypothetical protein